MKIKYLLGAMGLMVAGASGLVLPAEYSASANDLELIVYGEATEEVSPDHAKIYGVIENTCVDCSDIKTEVVDAFGSLQDELESLGLESDAIVSQYYYESVCVFDGSVILKANLDFYIQTKGVDNLSEIIDLVSSQENARVKRIKFEVENDDAYNKALNMATENATSKANRLLNTDELVISEIEEECYYYCNYSYKEYVELENQNLVDNVKVTARVKVTFTQASLDSTELEVGEGQGGEADEREITDENVDKETGRLIEEDSDVQTLENIDESQPIKQD